MQELATGYGLIEGPVWDPGRGLYFSDVLNGGVRLLTPSGEVETIVERRRGVGGMALHAEHGLVFSGRDISYFDLSGGPGAVLLTPQDAAPGAIGFNDLTTDRDGRVYVGSLSYRVFGGDEPKPGSLHVIDLDGRARTVSGEVGLTNGLGVSPDGRRLYHSDTNAGWVRAYELGPGGAVGRWEVFARLGPNGRPDGLKVAADGSVWVADADGGRVAVFGPDGAHRMDLAVPLPMVTSLCFGGEGLSELYVVTGSRGGPSEACGTIFRMKSPVPGLALAPARVKITAPAQPPAA